MPEIDVYAINLSRRIALMSDNTIRDVTNLFDAAGNETDDPAAAASCVVKNHEESWFACTLGEFDRTTLQ